MRCILKLIGNIGDVTIFFNIDDNDSDTFKYCTYSNTLSLGSNDYSIPYRHGHNILKDFNTMSEEELFQESVGSDLKFCVYLIANIQKSLAKNSHNFINNGSLRVDY